MPQVFEQDGAGSAGSPSSSLVTRDLNLARGQCGCLDVLGMWST